MSEIRIRRIAFCAVVAASYTALTVVIAPISFGPIQFRIAEALCILPFFFPLTAAGLFVGCLIANFLSPYGLLDIIAGSAATLIAALITMQLGRISRGKIWPKVLACLPPVFINALIIGMVITWSETGGGAAFQPVFLVNALQIGLGQFTVMYVIGLPLMIYLPKSYIFNKLSKQYLQ